MVEAIFEDVLDYVPAHTTEKCYFCLVLDSIELMDKIQTSLEFRPVWVCGECKKNYKN